MDKFAVQLNLEAVREARLKWGSARKEFDAQVTKITNRLLHEAATNRMSVKEVSVALGKPSMLVRSMMMTAGLDPRVGKTLLAESAAKALAENAELLGVEPNEIDLMSPLAYLPMGAEMRARLAPVSGITSEYELADFNPSTGHLHGCDWRALNPDLGCTKDCAGLLYVLAQEAGL